MEHFSRLTTRDVDLLFIVSDRAGGVSDRFQDSRHHSRTRSSDQPEVLIITGPRVTWQWTRRGDQEPKTRTGGVIPTDEEVLPLRSRGKADFGLPLESKSVQAARGIFQSTFHSLTPHPFPRGEKAR